PNTPRSDKEQLPEREFDGLFARALEPRAVRVRRQPRLTLDAHSRAAATRSPERLGTDAGPRSPSRARYGYPRSSARRRPDPPAARNGERMRDADPRPAGRARTGVSPCLGAAASTASQPRSTADVVRP